MGILALDIATQTGAAFCVPGERPKWLHQNFGGSGKTPGQIGHEFETWLEQLIAEYKPGVLVFETPYVQTVPQWKKKKGARLTNGDFLGDFENGQLVPGKDGGGGINAAVVQRLYGMKFLAETVAHRTGLKCHELRTTQVCEFFTGRGSWGVREKKKAETVRICKEQGFLVANDDEADAIAALLYAEHWLFPTIAQKARPIGPLLSAPMRVIKSDAGSVSI